MTEKKSILPLDVTLEKLANSYREKLPRGKVETIPTCVLGHIRVVEVKLHVFYLGCKLFLDCLVVMKGFMWFTEKLRHSCKFSIIFIMVWVLVLYSWY